MKMKTVEKILSVIRSVWANALALRKLKRLSDGDYFVSKNIPYQCQFATPGLAADILEGRIGAADDPGWKSFGFGDPKEYAYWSFRVCGIACLKMILDFYRLGRGRTVAELTFDGVRRGGYVTAGDKGWFFRPLLEQMKADGLDGFTSSFFGIGSICDLIAGKKFFIASVNPALVRFDRESADAKPGGHLVLVVGFRVKNKKIEGIFINNPSGKLAETRERAFVPIKIFKKAYSNRGIAVWK